MSGYKFTTEVDPDTGLLAEMLQAEYRSVMESELLSGVGAASAMTLAWYRVAERAKELRA
jgi:hypothetical protein